MNLLETLEYFLTETAADMDGLSWEIREETNYEDNNIEYLTECYDFNKELYDNLKQIKLMIEEKDPGIYAAWNIAIKEASGEYITNANLDDRKFPNALEELAKKLYTSPEIDGVYANNLVTNNANETWDKNTAKSNYPSEPFSEESMLRGNPLHCMPMWRKSIHDKYGYFEEKYRSASDWEMWLRCTFEGSKFLKLNKTLGLYYFNPKGMSTNQDNNSWKRKEEKEIFQKYLAIFQKRLTQAA